jgi:DNA polymerase-3 subunit delta'
MATAARIADELLALLDASVGPLKERQATELQELTDRNTRNAEVVSTGRATKGRGRATKAALGAGVAELEERHRREQRRQRTDELRAGLAVLAGAYRERLASPAGATARRRAIEAVGRLDHSVKTLEFNPAEAPFLQSLLARLSFLG